MEWYYVQGRERMGPVAEDEFQRLVAECIVRPETFVWNPDLPDWTRFGVLPPVESPPRKAIPLERCVECGQCFPADQVIPFGPVYVCGACKPVFFQRVRQGTVYPLTAPYAGFGIRVCAKVIDWVIVGVFQTALQTALMSTVSVKADDLLFIALSAFMGMMTLVILIAYNTWFIGRFGATPGKMACGLRVVLADGSRVSYPRALGRAAGELVSGVVFYLGYVIVAFEGQRRALHDFFCDTRVLCVKEAGCLSTESVLETETACPRCGGPVGGEAEYAASPRLCPHCRASFISAVFPAAFTGEFQAGYGQPVREEPEAACFHHGGQRAETACAACGRFLCALCAMDVRGTHFCSSCLEHGIRTGAFPEFQASCIRYDLLALGVACIPFMLVLPLLLFVLPWATEIALGFSLAFLIFPAFVTAPAAAYLALRFRKDTAHPLGFLRGWTVLVFILSSAQLFVWVVAGMVFLGNIFTEF